MKRKLLDWLETQDDRKIIKKWLPRLKTGPVAAKALRWEDIADEWDDEFIHQ